MEKKLDGAQWVLDSSGTVLSMLCAMHCLLLPLVITWLPSLGLAWLSQGWVHLLLLGMVVPVFVMAMLRGTREHGQTWVLLPGVAGLASLLAAVVWGHALHMEGALTLVGSLLLTASHAANIVSCRQHCQSVPVSSETQCASSSLE